MERCRGQRRVGLLIPHTDMTSEIDLLSRLPEDVSLHAQRIWLDDVTVEAEEKMLRGLPKAAACLKPVKPQAVVFGCTSAGALYGLSGDREIAAMLEDELGCPAVTAFGAVVEELRRLGTASLGLITPYVESLTDRVEFSLKGLGFKVIHAAGMGEREDERIGAVLPQTIRAFVYKEREKMHGADALFISCTNLRAMECREELEREIGIPVVTSNAAVCRRLMDILYRL